MQGRKVAGITPQNEPGPTVWSTYINVDNADAVAELVAANGGEVMVPPFEVAPYGTKAIFIDPPARYSAPGNPPSIRVPRSATFPGR